MIPSDTAYVIGRLVAVASEFRTDARLATVNLGALGIGETVVFDSHPHRIQPPRNGHTMRLAQLIETAIAGSDDDLTERFVAWSFDERAIVYSLFGVWAREPLRALADGLVLSEGVALNPAPMARALQQCPVFTKARDLWGEGVDYADPATCRRAIARARAMPCRDLSLTGCLDPERDGERVLFDAIAARAEIGRMMRATPGLRHELAPLADECTEIISELCAANAFCPELVNIRETVVN